MRLFISIIITTAFAGCGTIRPAITVPTAFGSFMLSRSADGMMDLNFTLGDK